ncbi:MAG: cytochrome c3 family protein [Nitrospiraceae bacterium]|nr:cytochrome c3 family protein [Nitrospiraceae bacterium]
MEAGMKKEEKIKIKIKNSLKVFFAVLAVLLAAMAFLSGAARGQERADEDGEKCLGCHGKREMTKKLREGRMTVARIDEKAFRASAHGFLSCRDCHEGLFPPGGRHPSSRFRSREQFEARYSRICRRCHPDRQLREKGVHNDVLEKESGGQTPVCTDCHSAHSMKPAPRGRILTAEEIYCMGCHSRPLSMTFKRDEAMPVDVDVREIKSSVHSSLGCSDCHYGFSSQEHPVRNFKTRRDYVIASSDNCRRCHFDKYAQNLESTHNIILSKGNLKAPVCSDCHGSHATARIAREKTVIARRCRGCHTAVYEKYARSVHGRALLEEGNLDVPACTDCHPAHNIKDPFTLSYRERTPEMCANCHGNKAIASRYGLSVDVVKTYLTDFHGVTLGFYRDQKGESYRPGRPIAVCTDCHGSHEIKGTLGPDAAVLKANLVRACARCHAGATANFPDAWLSHYGPSLRNAPLVFIVNLAYRIFIPVMLTGLFLQILLHIWRYAVNR